MSFATDVGVTETHISVVFFVGDRVYKLKKPVKFGFLDFSTAELRREACRREVALNRRFAPDVYLGVAEVSEPDRPGSEPLVVMRRMPPDRRLSTLVAEGADVAEELRAVARLMVWIHSETATSPVIAAAATAEALAQRWARAIAEVEPFAGNIVDAELVGRLLDSANRYIAGRNRLFTARREAGRVRDGHGDLRADDIFMLADGPRVLDCIEFDDSLRYIDVLDDVCFLAMDLERLGAPELAERFLSVWREFSGDSYPASLADHYIAYRAMVRVKVACLRASQGDRNAIGEARALLRIAQRHLERGRVRLVLVGGLPGTGKSTLADGLGREHSWSVIRTDVRRKQLVGLPASVHRESSFGEALYAPAMTAVTYAEVLDEAYEAIKLGETVVLDASWTNASWRRAARLAASTTSADVIELRCVAPESVAVDRLQRRPASDPSDATSAIALAMRGHCDPWPEAISIDTSGSCEHSLRQALDAVSKR